MRQEKGFTLIELIVVIVILGILSATALPKFIDLKSDAADAAVKGAAGALSSAMSINYGAYVVNSTKTGVVRLSTTSACAAMTAGMATWDTAKFSISSEATCGTTVGSTGNCTIQSRDDTTKTAAATVICTG